MLEVHGRRQVSEATIGGTNSQKRSPQFHAAVIDVKLSVSRHRVADHGITTEVCQRIARIAEVVSAELTCTRGLEDISARVARPKNVAGPHRTTWLGPLQGNKRHRRRK